MTPKSLLRHKECVSPLADLTGGGFHNVLDDGEAPDPKKVKRVVVCSGKVYYDLVAARRERKLEHVAILRMEQLYPFPMDGFREVFRRYAKATEVVWTQEEPQNQGAWFYMQPILREYLKPGQTLTYAGRPASASPAVGYSFKHVAQQKALIEQALG